MSAVSAGILAAAAGCGQPTQAGHAAPASADSMQASVPPGAESATGAQSPAGAASPSAASRSTAAAARPSATGTPPPKPGNAQLAGRIRPDVTYRGKATFYDAGDGNGACLFGPAGDLMIGAMNETDYESSKACGAYVQVRVASGASVTVRITNLCPLPCAPGQIDLSPQAFAKLADPKLGEVPITWKLLSPGMSDSISIRYKAGSSQWWCGIQVINHRNPVARLEIRSGGGWRQLTRADYNYFLSPNGDGCGGAIRVTDIYGEQLTVNGIALSADVMEPTRVQFAQH
ncbi:expansin EXLX1 family cellulose-binding protein [Dactylosporangium sp. McL0621]|uniref:expansin EXLX1 family cellulose-binding protein n=1 Tax=Dactylosporangium sp. McL0621 TaxID=3415678 RepID=UPI003CE6D2D9